MLTPTISLSGYHSKVIIKDHSPGFQYNIISLANKIKSAVINIFEAFVHLAQTLSSPIVWTCKMFQKPKLPYVILALDGGGVRGKVSLAALKQIEQEIGGKLIHAVDCLAGVSTGGIISAALSVPSAENPNETRYSAHDVDSLYDEFAMQVFPNSSLHDISTLFGTIRAKYPSPRSVLESITSDMPYTKSLAKKLIITSVDLLSGNVIFFENDAGAAKANQLGHKHIKPFIVDDEVSFCDVLEATSAAPTYFPTKVFKDYNLIDGGIAENNPAEIATLLAMKEIEKDRPILVISLGTGKTPHESITTKDPLYWGWVQWAGPIIDYLFHTKAQQTNAQMEQMAENDSRISYVRFQANLDDPSELPLDNASPENMRKLEELGTRTFKHFLDNGGRESIIVPLREKLKALQI